MTQNPEPKPFLTRKNGCIYARNGRGEEVKVKILWLRPLSGRGREVSLLDTGNKEVALFASIDELDEESRAIAQAELDRRYLVPRILRVKEATARYGSRYWDVETHLGDRRFILKNATKNALWMSSEHLVLRDTMGNSYEINPFSGLDARSRTLVEKLL